MIHIHSFDLTDIIADCVLRASLLSFRKLVSLLSWRRCLVNRSCCHNVENSNFSKILEK